MDTDNNAEGPSWLTERHIEGYLNLATLFHLNPYNNPIEQYITYLSNSMNHLTLLRM
jgi:hypothetical protein